jgi:hypothetical protein
MKQGVSMKPAAASGAARWPRRLAAASGAATVLAILVLGLLARHEPAFYGSAAVAAASAAVELNARRMLSKASSMHAAIRSAAPWDAVITADEVNAWLAVDLPRNHSQLLPANTSALRVAFAPHRVLAGVRLGSGVFSAVAWVDAEVRLCGVNQVGLGLVDARLGSLPLPRAALIRELARQLHALGLVTDLRWGESGPLLVVSAPATYDAAPGARLEMLAVGDGELLLAGGGPGRNGAERK